MVRDALVKLIGVWKDPYALASGLPFPVQSFVTRFDSDETLYQGIRAVVGEIMARKSLITIKDEGVSARDWNNIRIFSTDEFRYLETEVLILAAPYPDGGEGTRH